MTDKDPEPVGYGKPPVSGRFQKGLSGNPSGARRKRRDSEDLRALFEKVLFEPIAVRDGKGKRKMPRIELFYRQVSTGSIKGNTKEQAHLIALLRAFGLTSSTNASEDTLDDRAVIAEFLRRLSKSDGEAA
jgi:hypothetical protein